jgi:hypothetical protein
MSAGGATSRRRLRDFRLLLMLHVSSAVNSTSVLMTPRRLQRTPNPGRSSRLPGRALVVLSLPREVPPYERRHGAEHPERSRPALMVPRRSRQVERR